MNQSNSSVRCPHCNLLNFATEPFCKRCKNNLQNFGGQTDQNSININISFPSSVKPQINAQTDYQPNPPINQNFQPQSNQPQLNQPAQNSTENAANSSEYQLLNQTGFEQWQQQNKSENQPNNQPTDASNYGRNYQPNYGQNQPPYQPNYPQLNYPPPNNYQMQQATVWRRGNEIVAHKYGGMLPDSCVKCGEHLGGHAGGGYITQKYRWHSPYVYIALVSPLIYAILAAALSQRVQIEVPLCGKHLADRQTTGKMMLGGGLAAIAAIFFFGSFGYAGFAFLIFLVSLIGIVLGYEYSYKPLQISKIENDYVYLKNADNRYLNRLPY